MNINEFAQYILDRDTEQSDELWMQLYDNLSFDSDKLNELLSLIANEDTPSEETYLGDLLEWLNDDNNTDYVDYVIQDGYKTLESLLRAAKLNRDNEEYSEVLNMLQDMLDNLDEDIELSEVAVEYNVDEILAKL